MNNTTEESGQKWRSQDCHFLIGDLIEDNEFPFNCIIENEAKLHRHPKYSHDGAKYMSKRDLLFQFEQQLTRTDTFCGQFGDDTSVLFSEYFDIYKAAWEMKKDHGGDYGDY